MGFFDHLVQRQGVSTIRSQRPCVRSVERKPSPSPASPSASSSTSKPRQKPRQNPPSRSASVSASASPSPSPSRSRPTTNRNNTSSSRTLAARAASNGVRKIPLSSARSRSSRTGNGNGGTPSTTTSTTATSKASSSSATVTANAPAPATVTISRIRKRPSTYDQPLSSDSSDNDDSSDVDMALEMRKRTKTSVSVEPDFKRRIKMPAAFDEANPALRSLKFVHADDISSSPDDDFDAAFVDAKAAKNVPRSKWVRVEMQYPSACPRERYALVVPHDDDGFKPIDDIVRTVDAIAENYIPHTHLSVFDDPSTGLKRRFRRALAHASQSEFCETLADYIKIISKMRKDGVVSAHLDTIHALPLSLVERILTQIYARTVSPRVETLKRYENGSDNVYGELLPRFITDIFKQTRLKSGQIFVDLGSGVGNVVLQAALEIGCESWGCEMMANACDLAELQQREFEARCVLWGIAPGSVHLVRGDFLKEDRIIDVLRRADVVLINNQAFTPQLNDKITNLFLEMKEGVQIVSLKPFVPAGHKITARNLNNPINLLSNKEFDYWSEYVSWTDAGGSYFIATKDSQHLRRFAERMRG